MSLVTRCPKCQTEYEVSVDQLKLHDGLVRCGNCEHVFDGFACLKDSLPTLTRRAQDPPIEPVKSAPASTPVLSVLVEHDQAQSWPEPTPEPEPEPERIEPPAPAPALDEQIPEQQAPEQQKIDSDQLGESDDRFTAGRFIPSVDRAARTNAPAGGRQEPAFGPQPASSSSRELREPKLGPLTSRQRRDEVREPTLNPLRAASTQAVSPVPESIEPAVRVMGEARLKGDDPSAFGRTVPEFLEDEPEPAEGIGLLWVIGSIVLALVLVVQSIVVFRHDIVSAAPTLRPLLVQICQPLSCDVSHVRQIERIFIVGSALQQAPSAGAQTTQRDYVLRLTLQNRGAYAQPWPALMLTLTDASGTAVIRRAVMPTQYLPSNLLNAPFAARQEVSLDIGLTVDGLNISGYELEKFFP